jgi:hypothetical protein
MNKPPDLDVDSSNSNLVSRLIAYCRDNSRVCPMPQQWNTLWTMLPNRSRIVKGLGSSGALNSCRVA